MSAGDFDLVVAPDGKAYYMFERVHSETIIADLTDDYASVPQEMKSIAAYFGKAVLRDLEEENFVESSVSVQGDLGIDISGKVKVVSVGLNGKIRKEIGSKNQHTTIETLRTTLIIPPHRKLTVITKGEAYINSGVACYYFLGIRFKKGAWEYIDVISEYYDYYETAI